jgi:hypothetical protein
LENFPPQLENKKKKINRGIRNNDNAFESKAKPKKIPVTKRIFVLGAFR